MIKEIMSLKIDTEITFIQLYRYTSILFTVPALNISDSKVEYFNYKNTPDIKVIDAIVASSSLPLLFPPYKINGSYYYDGGLCNNCTVNLVDELDSIAFDISHTNKDNNSNFKLYDLLLSLTMMSNKLHCNSKSDIIYQILDSRFKNETVNINQTRDDIFNIYMNGYINSKNVIYDNFIALPPIN